jgi:preprotein translocase subunit SecG
MMSTRGQANLLTRVTSVLAAAFMTTSLLLAIFASDGNQTPSIIELMPTEPQAPALPTLPSVPALPEIPALPTPPAPQ